MEPRAPFLQTVGQRRRLSQSSSGTTSPDSTHVTAAMPRTTGRGPTHRCGLRCRELESLAYRRRESLPGRPLYKKVELRGLSGN